MILYHFTSDRFRRVIMGSGVLIPSESNIGAPVELIGRGFTPIGRHVGPDVVWLTDHPDNADGLGLEMPDESGDRSLKKTLQVAVQVPEVDAHRWSDWSTRHGIDERWRDVLELGNDPDRWWVVERPIEAAEWTELRAIVPAVERNRRCLCGSGAKYKNCHLGRKWHTVWSAGDPLPKRYSAAEVLSAKEGTEVDASGEVVVAARGVDPEVLRDFESDPWGRW